MARTTIAEAPSINLLVDNLGDVVNQVHDVLIQIAKQVRKVGDATKSK